MRYGEVVLRIKRTLDGVEIDTIISISEVEVRKALAMERQRRADRRKRAGRESLSSGM